MSRFYGSLEGSAKTAVTRRGTTNKPCKAHVRTWTHGVEVLSDVDSNGREYFAVYATGGSNRPGLTRLIATVVATESGAVNVWHSPYRENVLSPSPNSDNLTQAFRELASEQVSREVTPNG